MTKSYIVPCLYCGEPFYYPPSRIRVGRLQYCSWQCKGNDFRDNNQDICEGCGKGFYVSLSDKNRGRGKYCSRKCYNSIKSEQAGGRGSSFSQEFHQQIIETYQVGNSLGETARVHKCSVNTILGILRKYEIPRRTRAEGNQLHFRKRLPADIERQMIEVYQTGKSMQEVNRLFSYPRGTMESIVKRNGIIPYPMSQVATGRVFTDEHKGKISQNHHNVSGKNNPMYGKSPGHGKWIYVKHLGRRVRSEWEYKIALVLQGLGIKHKYENHRIYFKDGTYMPDFYLPDYDLYIEVKGWMNARSKNTLRKLFSEKPHINLLVISSHRYKMILNNPDSLLMFIKMRQRHVRRYDQLELPF